MRGERTDTLSEGMNSALPCQLYVLNKDTGELAGEEFSKEVESCKVRYKSIQKVRRKWNM